MLEIAIPNHEAELQQLEAIGLSGYFLGLVFLGPRVRILVHEEVRLAEAQSEAKKIT